MVLDNLKKIRTLLSDESKWTKHVYARNNYDTHTDELSDDACKWCLMGAILRVTEQNHEVKREITSLLKGYIVKGYIGVFRDNRSREYYVIDYNDANETKYQDIVNLLDTAIENKSVVQ